MRNAENSQHVVMLVRNSLSFDTRVKKQALTLSAHGYRVTVVGTSRRALPDEEQLGPVVIKRIRPPTPTRELERRLEHRRLRAENRLRWRPGQRVGQFPGLGKLGLPLVRAPYLVAGWGVRRLSSSTRRVLKEHWCYRLAVEPILVDLRPDVVHAHDLGTIYAAERYCRATGTALVYDAHELELARRRKRKLLARLVDRRVERTGIQKAAAVITVSGGIARELSRAYGVDPPEVVLNSPSLKARDVRSSLNLREAARLKPDDVLAVYEGVVIAKRVGLEQLVRALSILPARFHVGFLGPPASPRVQAALDALAARLDVNDRVHWFGAVPYEQVPAVLSTATCSVIPIQNVHRNYDLALPNKFFDPIMAGIPVGVARLHEMQRLVTTHEIGVVFDEKRPKDIAAALVRLEAMSLDPTGALASRFARLQREIAWERQEAVLLRIYGSLAAVSEDSSARRTIRGELGYRQRPGL